MDFLSDGFEIYLNFSKNPYLSDFCGDIFFVRSSQNEKGHPQGTLGIEQVVPSGGF